MDDQKKYENSINYRIQLIRETLDKKPKQFAEMLGYSRQQISKFEGYNTFISEYTKKAICAILNVNWEYLENGVEPMFNERARREEKILDSFSKLSEETQDLAIYLVKCLMQYPEDNSDNS